MQYIIFFSILSIFAALLSAYLGDHGRYHPKIILKTTASLMFCAVGVIFSVQTENSGYALRIFIFLALSFLGDILLTLHVILPEKLKNISNLLGGLLFLGAHILLFFTLIQIAKLNLILLLILPLLPIIVAILAKVKVISITKKLALPCIIYALALSLLLVACFNIALSSFGRLPFRILIMVAGAAFVISDLFLLLANFGKGEKLRKKSMYVVMALYYLAQNIFAFTIFYA